MPTALINVYKPPFIARMIVWVLFFPICLPVIRPNVWEKSEVNFPVILEFFPQGPYFLAGHSFGGIMALEISRLLIEEGFKVPFLGIIETRAPGTRRLSRLRVYIFFIRMYNQRLFFHLRIIFKTKQKHKIQYSIYKIKSVLKRLKKFFDTKNH